MTEQQIMNYINLTAENTALKMEKTITNAVATHERGCADQFNGRIEMMENAVLSMAGKNNSIRFDRFGPYLAWAFKNWKAVAVVIMFMLMLWGRTTGGKITADDVNKFIQQVKQIESLTPQSTAAAAEKKTEG